MSTRTDRVHSSPPQFAMTGLVVGACAGLAAGLVMEIVRRRTLVVMQASGLGGLAIGALFESVRLWWRRRRYQTAHQKSAISRSHRR